MHKARMVAEIAALPYADDKLAAQAQPPKSQSGKVAIAYALTLHSTNVGRTVQNDVLEELFRKCRH